jgi:hypothetical protein
VDRGDESELFALYLRNVAGILKDTTQTIQELVDGGKISVEALREAAASELAPVLIARRNAIAEPSLEIGRKTILSKELKSFSAQFGIELPSMELRAPLPGH